MTDALRLSPIVLAGAWSVAIAAPDLERFTSLRLVPVVIALQVNGQPVSAHGDGLCFYRPQSAQHVDGDRWAVNYTGLRGGKAITFAMSVRRAKGAGRTDATITIGGSGKTRRVVLRDQHASGSGTVGVEPAGAGYRFTLEVKDRDGVSVNGMVTCQRVTPER